MFDILNFFFFNDTATTEIYTLSLHDALPISRAERGTSGAHRGRPQRDRDRSDGRVPSDAGARVREDRKSTRLNSSHANISYAVFCLKKKKIKQLSQYRVYKHHYSHNCGLCEL